MQFPRGADTVTAQAVAAFARTGQRSYLPSGADRGSPLDPPKKPTQPTPAAVREPRFARRLACWSLRNGFAQEVGKAFPPTNPFVNRQRARAGVLLD